MRRLRDGGTEPVEVEVHPDPRCQAVLEQIREAEVVQAVDRVRPIFNRRRLLLLNELCLDITYDSLMTHTELVAGGSRLERIAESLGIVPRNPADLCALCSELTERQARRLLENSPPDPNRNSIWERGEVFRYRIAGRRGSVSRAWIDRGRHPDPQAALAALIGPITRFGPDAAEAPPEATLPADVVAAAAPLGGLAAGLLAGFRRAQMGSGLPATDQPRPALAEAIAGASARRLIDPPLGPSGGLSLEEIQRCGQDPLIQ